MPTAASAPHPHPPKRWTVSKFGFYLVSLVTMAMILLTDSLFLVELGAYVAPFAFNASARLATFNALLPGGQQSRVGYCDTIVAPGDDFFGCALFAFNCIDNSSTVFVHATNQIPLNVSITFDGIRALSNAFWSSVSYDSCLFSIRNTLATSIAQLQAQLVPVTAMVAVQAGAVCVSLGVRAFLGDSSLWPRFIFYYAGQVPLLFLKAACLPLLWNSACWLSLATHSCPTSVQLDDKTATVLGWIIANVLLNALECSHMLFAAFSNKDQKTRSAIWTLIWLPLALGLLMCPVLIAFTLDDPTMLIVSSTSMNLFTFSRVLGFILIPLNVLLSFIMMTHHRLKGQQGTLFSLCQCATTTLPSDIEEMDQMDAEHQSPRASSSTQFLHDNASVNLFIASMSETPRHSTNADWDRSEFDEFENPAHLNYFDVRRMRFN